MQDQVQSSVQGSPMDVDQSQSKSKSRQEKPHTKTPLPRPKTRYRGRRIGCGKDMPLNFREDTVIAFVEAIAWTFSCRLERPRAESKLEMQRILLPVTQTASVYRSPADRLLARKGLLEGPLLGVQCRSETRFRKKADKSSKSCQVSVQDSEEDLMNEAPQNESSQNESDRTEASAVPLDDAAISSETNSLETNSPSHATLRDILYEVGLMLLLAQKRSREGQKEPSWDDRWWVKVPRWGGGPGGPVEVAPRESDGYEADSNGRGRKKARMSLPQERYKNLEPPRSMWDKNITYQRIGKAKRGDFDDVSSRFLLPLSFVRCEKAAENFLFRKLSTSRRESRPIN